MNLKPKSFNLLWSLLPYLIILSILLFIFFGIKIDEDDSKEPYKDSINSKPLKIYTYHEDLSNDSSAYKIVSQYIKTELSNIKSKYINEIKSETTSGSLHTLLSIDNDTAALGIGIVQSDVLFHYLNGEHPEMPRKNRKSKVRAVARLFPEWVDITIKNKNNRNKDINIIKEATETYCQAIGSGSMVTASNIKRTLELKWDISSSKTDFVVYVANPIELYKNKDTSVRKLYLDASSSIILQKAFPDVYYRVPIITFKSLKNDTLVYEKYAISQDAILVVTEMMNDSIVKNLHSIINDASINKKIGGILNYTSYSDASDSSNYFSKNRYYRLPVVEHAFNIRENYKSKLARTTIKRSLLIVWLFLVFAGGFFLWGQKYYTETLHWIKVRNTKFIIKGFLLILRSVIVIIAIIAFIQISFMYAIYNVEYFSRISGNEGNIEILQMNFFELFKWSTKVFFGQSITYTFQSDFSSVLIYINKIIYIVFTTYFGYVITRYGFKISKLFKPEVILLGWNHTAIKVINKLHNKSVYKINIIGQKESVFVDIPSSLKNKIERRFDSYENYTDIRYYKAKQIYVLYDKKLSEIEGYFDVNLWVIHKVIELKNIIEINCSNKNIKIIGFLRKEVQNCNRYTDDLIKDICDKIKIQNSSIEVKFLYEDSL